MNKKLIVLLIAVVALVATIYKECTEVATGELNSNARPEFKNANSLNMDNYDTIFIGYPIWWGDVPMIINTFLEKYDCRLCYSWWI